MNPLQSSRPLALEVLWAVRRHGWVLVMSVAACMALAAGVRAALPASYAASGIVRVGALYPNPPILAPATVATESATGAFLARARERARVQDGQLEALAFFQTEDVQVKAYGAEPAVAEKLCEAATALIVEEQNALLEGIRRRALDDLKSTCSAAVVSPVLTRPAARLLPAEPARSTVPGVPLILAIGAGAGLAVGALWLYVRAVSQS